LLKTLFDETSSVQLPVGVAREVLEIREWAKKQLEKNEQPTK
tara:strand:+ start:807 stop:932 length:126 start_codon:yes stop_codon:yes gene_type:complete